MKAITPNSRTSRRTNDRAVPTTTIIFLSFILIRGFADFLWHHFEILKVVFIFEKWPIKK